MEWLDHGIKRKKLDFIAVYAVVFQQIGSSYSSKSEVVFQQIGSQIGPFQQRCFRCRNIVQSTYSSSVAFVVGMSYNGSIPANRKSNWPIPAALLLLSECRIIAYCTIVAFIGELLYCFCGRIAVGYLSLQMKPLFNKYLK
jgi:hypothetical protein